SILLLTLVTILVYIHMQATSTCEYLGGRVVIGKTLKPAAQEQISRQSGIGCGDLIFMAASNPENVWPAQEIEFNRMVLGATYIGLAALLALSILTIAQIITLAESA